MRNLDKNKIIDFLNKDISPSKIDDRVMSLFLKQLSLLTSSGLGLDKSIKILQSQNIDKKLNKSLHNINSDLDNGMKVYEAFYNNKKSFDPLILAFIKSGDESGRLGEVLDQLSDYINEESKNKATIKQAMTYPLLLLFVTLVIVILLSSFVLPTFADIFEKEGQALPLGTRILIGFSDFISRYGFLILLFILIFTISILILRKDDSFRYKLDKLTFTRFPLRNLRRLRLEYQFSSLFYILKAGDIGMLTSLYIIKDSFNNTYIKTSLEKMIDDVKRGVSLSQTMVDAKIFGPLITSMIKIGEDSSMMLDALKKASEYYANEYIYRLKRFSSILEPVIIIIMSIIVAFVVFSVSIPIFDSVNAL